MCDSDRLVSFQIPSTSSEGTGCLDSVPEQIATTTPVECKSIVGELRRSSDVFRAILWNLSFRDTNGYTDDCEPEENNELDLPTLFDRHEQRRYTDFKLENDQTLLDSQPSSKSLQSLSSIGGIPSEAMVSSSALDEHIQSQHPQCNDDQSTPPNVVGHKKTFKIDRCLSLDQTTKIAEVYTKQYLMTLPPIFLAVARQNSTMVYLLLKSGVSPNIQVTLNV